MTFLQGVRIGREGEVLIKTYKGKQRKIIQRKKFFPKEMILFPHRAIFLDRSPRTIPFPKVSSFEEIVLVLKSLGVRKVSPALFSESFEILESFRELDFLTPRDFGVSVFMNYPGNPVFGVEIDQRKWSDFKELPVFDPWGGSSPQNRKLYKQ